MMERENLLCTGIQKISLILILFSVGSRCDWVKLHNAPLILGVSVTVCICVEGHQIITDLTMWVGANVNCDLHSHLNRSLCLKGIQCILDGLKLNITHMLCIYNLPFFNFHNFNYQIESALLICNHIQQVFHFNKPRCSQYWNVKKKTSQ